MADEMTEGLKALSDQIKEQNRIAREKKTEKENLSALKELVKNSRSGNKTDKENSKELQKQFMESQSRLASAVASGDAKQIKVEKDSQNAIMETVQTEEQRREAEKATAQQNGFLEKMSDGIAGLGKKVEEFGGNLAFGLLAGLAIFKPEAVQKILANLVMFFQDMLQIGEIIAGVEEGGLKEIGELILSNIKGLFVAAFLLSDKLRNAIIFGPIEFLFTKAFDGLKKAYEFYKKGIIGDFVRNQIINLYFIIKDAIAGIGAKFTKLREAFIRFRYVVFSKFIPNMLANIYLGIASMLASVKAFAVARAGAAFVALKAASVAFAAMVSGFIMTTVVPALGVALIAIKGAFIGLLTTLGGVAVAMAPFLVIGLKVIAIIGVAVLGIIAMKKLFDKIADMLGLEKTTDLITLAFFYVKDGLNGLANFFIGLANKIGTFVGQAATIFGLDVPDFIMDMATMKKKDTNQAERFLAESRARGDALVDGTNANISLQEQAASSRAGTNVGVGKLGGDTTVDRSTTNIYGNTSKRDTGWSDSDINSYVDMIPL